MRFRRCGDDYAVDIRRVDDGPPVGIDVAARACDRGGLCVGAGDPDEAGIIDRRDGSDNIPAPTSGTD
jgi:hypothetical protein